MRLLWSLPKAAPYLLRHIAAYIDLAWLDLERTKRETAAQVIALAIFALGAVFAVLLGCLTVVAATWDTPNRVHAIAWMTGGFALIALIAWLYRAKLAREQAELFAAVRREWQEDRVLLERLLSDED